MKLAALALYLAFTAATSIAAEALPMPTCDPNDTACVKAWMCANTGRCK